MSRRSKHQSRLEDAAVYRAWVAEGSYSRAAALLGCSGQHVKNVRERHEMQQPIIHYPRHYVEQPLNMPPQYPRHELSYSLTPGHLVMIDINYLAAVVVTLSQILSSIRAPLLGLLLLPPLLGMWHMAAEGGRYRREALRERGLL